MAKLAWEHKRPKYPWYVPRVGFSSVITQIHSNPGADCEQIELEGYRVSAESDLL